MIRNTVSTVFIISSAISYINTWALLDSPALTDLSTSGLTDRDSNSQKTCFSTRSNPRIVDKRQLGAFCDGDNCGIDQAGISEPLTTEDQSNEWKQMLGNLDKPIALAAPSASASQGTYVSGDDQSSDNAVASSPLNDVVVNPSWSITSGNLAPDKVDDENHEIMPDAIAGGAYDVAAKAQGKIEQDPDDGWPTEDFCPAQPDDTYGAYLVRLIEYDIGGTRGNPQAIIVSDLTLHATFKYEAVKLNQRQFVWQKIPWSRFIRPDRTIIKLSRFEVRGWLVPLPEENPQAALAWFEGIAMVALKLPSTEIHRGGPLHFTAVCAAKVFLALTASHSPHWVPVTINTE